MQKTIDFRAITLSLFVAFVITYIICILGDVLFGWKMYQVWAPLLPGFTWPLTFSGSLIGLLWLVGYSVYASVLVVLPYNYFVSRKSAA